MDHYEFSRLLEQRRPGERYLEFLRVPALSAGVYVLNAGKPDPQGPHPEDEMYVVMSGVGAIRVGAEDRPVGPGAIVYVPAGAEHHFHSVTEELQILVVFA